MIAAVIAYILLAVVTAGMVYSLSKYITGYVESKNALHKSLDDSVLENFARSFQHVHETKNFVLYNDLIASLQNRIEIDDFLTEHGLEEARVMLETEQEIIVKLHTGEA